MNLTITFTHLTLSTVSIFLLFTGSVFAVGGDDWRPIDPAELALKTPIVEKDADAEALFWEVRVDDGNPGELVFSHYIRVKIFTERGKESQSRIDLTYLDPDKIKDVSARTIKPDGSFVYLNKEDIFDRTITKANALKFKAKSFALPGVEPGGIIEYRWRHVRPYAWANHLALQFQRDIPVQSITYLVRPRGSLLTMHYQGFQMPAGLKFEKLKDGFYRVNLSNATAYREEPQMPPENEVRSWILLYYRYDNDKKPTTPEQFWPDLGKRMHEASKDEMKVNDDVHRAIELAVSDATSAEEKLRRLYVYCQTKIKNVSYLSSGLTIEEREKFKPNKSPAETLKRGIGTRANINALFAALATAAGFEAHLALTADRDYIFLDRTFTDAYFLLRAGSSFIAIHLGNRWQFFSPAEPYTPFGMLRWREDGQSALIIDKEPTWVEVPILLPENSLAKRSGKFRLLADGTLEGEVRIEYNGQLAIDRNRFNEDDSPSEREKNLTDEIKGHLTTAEISNIRIENVGDPAKPFVYAYQIRVSGYASRTGKRLFLQPGFFTHGIGPLFPANDRKHNIYFHYPWSEQDHVTIDLPQGFALDNADAPPEITAQLTQNICEQKIRMAISRDGHTLTYDRRFFFGGRGKILFPVSRYAALKQLLDAINKADDHTITLKQSSATASN